MTLFQKLYSGIKWVALRIQAFGALTNIVAGVLFNLVLLGDWQTFRTAECGAPLVLWLLLASVIGLAVLLISSLGVLCVFVGSVTGWEAKAIAVKERLDDGGIELEDNEDPKLIDPYLDEPAEMMETQDRKPIENLYHAILDWSAKITFVGSLGLLAWVILGHLFYFRMDTGLCDVDLAGKVRLYLFFWDACAVLFLYKRYRG